VVQEEEVVLVVVIAVAHHSVEDHVVVHHLAEATETEKCIKQLVVSVAKDVRFHFAQQVISLYTVMIVLVQREKAHLKETIALLAILAVSHLLETIATLVLVLNLNQTMAESLTTN
jgi:hypothetical protein